MLETQIEYYKMRNPFTSVSNLSFLRNNSHVSHDARENYRPRSISSQKYFEYKKSYAHDHYLLDFNTRKQQQNKYFQVMGIEALRYCPQSNLQPQSQYYPNQDYPSAPLRQSDKFEELEPTDIKNNANQSCMKNTRDMFGSDYFSNRQEVGSQENPSKKSTLKRKDTNGSSRLRFNKVIEINYSRLSQQSSQMYQSGYNEKNQRIEKREENPKTIFLKSKKMIFYLYEDPYSNI